MTLNATLFTLVHQGARYYPALDWFFIALTSYAVYGVIAIVLMYICIALPVLAKDPALRLRRIGEGIEVVVSLFVVSVVVWALKVLVAHPRPFVALADTTPLVSASPFESFPSAHAALAMALAIAVLPYRKHLGHLLILFAFVIGLSRLYVGVHYPLDVAVGLALGYLVPKLIHRVFLTR